MRFTIPEEVLVREIDGEAVILDLRAERYFGLDDVGTRMWVLLTSAESVQEAYEALCSEYDVDPERLRRELDDFAEVLRKHGLIQVGAGSRPA